MSEVKRFVVDMQGRGEECVLSSDYDALAAECERLQRDYQTARDYHDAALAELRALKESMAYRTSLVGRLETERDQLRAELAALKGGQEPAATVRVWNPGGSGEFREYISERPLLDGTKLYTAPPAQASIWVAVSERLPAHLEVVLAWVTYSDDEGERQEAVDFADFHAPSQDNQWFSPYAFIAEQYPHVTHWQPLPAAPTPSASD